MQKTPAVVPLRITPAGAGKTAQTLIEYMGSEDHPRRCGENTCPRKRRKH